MHAERLDAEGADDPRSARIDAIVAHAHVRGDQRARQVVDRVGLAARYRLRLPQRQPGAREWLTTTPPPTAKPSRQPPPHGSTPSGPPPAPPLTRQCRAPHQVIAVQVVHHCHAVRVVPAGLAGRVVVAAVLKGDRHGLPLVRRTAAPAAPHILIPTGVASEASLWAHRRAGNPRQLVGEPHTVRARADSVSWADPSRSLNPRGRYPHRRPAQLFARLFARHDFFIGVTRATVVLRSVLRRLADNVVILNRQRSTCTQEGYDTAQWRVPAGGERRGRLT